MGIIERGRAAPLRQPACRAAGVLPPVERSYRAHLAVVGGAVPHRAAVGALVHRPEAEQLGPPDLCRRHRRHTVVVHGLGGRHPAPVELPCHRFSADALLRAVRPLRDARRHDAVAAVLPPDEARFEDGPLRRRRSVCVRAAEPWPVPTKTRQKHIFDKRKGHNNQ
jgi:hypothetical protein